MSYIRKRGSSKGKKKLILNPSKSKAKSSRSQNLRDDFLWLFKHNKKTISKIRKTLRVFPKIFILEKRFFHKRIVIGIILIVLGISLVCFKFIRSIPWFSSSDFPLSQSELNNSATPSALMSYYGSIRIDNKLTENIKAVEIPQRIIIPSQNIDLAVKEAKIINGFWEVFEKDAGHGIGSANPGQNGNIVIFAHAREKMFLNLRNSKKNDKIYILTTDGWRQYLITDTKEVDPQEIEVIQPTSDETLTLFTCSGFMDSKRLIVHAKPL